MTERSLAVSIYDKVRYIDRQLERNGGYVERLDEQVFRSLESYYDNSCSIVEIVKALDLSAMDSWTMVVGLQDIINWLNDFMRMEDRDAEILSIENTSTGWTNIIIHYHVPILRR